VLSHSSRLKRYAERTLRPFSIFLFSLHIAACLTGCRAEQPWPLWQAYTQRFVDDQGRVIDRSAADRTTSEGQAYAMFFALVDNDRRHFEQLLTWTEANLAAGDLSRHLPAWKWGRTASGDWKSVDGNSASDADLWLAYTLLEAGRLWREPRYETLGRSLADRIAREEVVLVPGLGTVLAPGPNGFHPDPQTWIVNPSYMPLPLLTRLAQEQPLGPWSAILESLPRLFDPQVGHGFAADWLSAGPNGVAPIAPPEEPTAGVRAPRVAGSYDAIRVYLWLGVSDPATPGRQALLTQLSGMRTLMRVPGALPPVEVNPLTGVARGEGSIGFSAAMIPYLAASGLRSQQRTQQNRMAAARDSSTGLYGVNPEYYDQNLVLFSTAWLDGRYRFERSGMLVVKWK